MKPYQLKNKKKPNDIQSEDSVKNYYSDNESDENPHGFVNADEIGHYRMRKSELKHFKREQEKKGLVEEKEKKYSHKKKRTEVSTTNKEKLKNKPLSMLRPKKNRIEKY